MIKFTFLPAALKVVFILSQELLGELIVIPCMIWLSRDVVARGPHNRSLPLNIPFFFKFHYGIMYSTPASIYFRQIETMNYEN